MAGQLGSCNPAAPKEQGAGPLSLQLPAALRGTPDDLNCTQRLQMTSSAEEKRTPSEAYALREDMHHLAREINSHWQTKRLFKSSRLYIGLNRSSR